MYLISAESEEHCGSAKARSNACFNHTCLRALAHGHKYVDRAVYQLVTEIYILSLYKWSYINDYLS